LCDRLLWPFCEDYASGTFSAPFSNKKLRIHFDFFKSAWLHLITLSGTTVTKNGNGKVDE
jgi:hypothetical protein